MCRGLKQATRNIALTMVVLVALVIQLHAQSFRELAAEVKQGYDSIHRVHIVIAVMVYENDKSESPLFVDQGTVKKDEQNFFYQFGGKDMIMNSKYTIVVDRQKREMFLSDRDLKGEKQFSDPVIVNMDSVFNLYEDPMMIDSTGSVVHYKLVQKKGQIKQVDMHIDVEKKELRKLEYRYRSGQYVVMDFLKFERNITFEENVFSEARYVVNINNQLKPADAFKGFRVVRVKQ
jgi:hypothetical protein